MSISPQSPIEIIRAFMDAMGKKDCDTAATPLP